MKKRSFKNIVGCLMLLGIVSILSACNELMTTQADSNSNTREGSMNLAYKPDTGPARIPPIDAAAPAVFETAAFGLG